MAITVEGVRINLSLEALQPNEGFVIRFNTNMRQDDNEERAAARKAQELGVLGTRLNSHEPTFSDAQTVIASEITDFATEMNQFIQNWNAGNIEGSPNYTPPE